NFRNGQLSRRANLTNDPELFPQIAWSLKQNLVHNYD
ncbi:unnamed protein product, partial [Allacma fusca]